MKLYSFVSKSFDEFQMITKENKNETLRLYIIDTSLISILQKLFIFRQNSSASLTKYMDNPERRMEDILE